MKFSQEFKQAQQLTMTPQLQQAIKLLQLSQLELSNLLIEELETNPALEEVVGLEEDTLEVDITDAISNDVDWDVFSEEDPMGRVTSEYEGKDALLYERFIAPETTLFDHLRFQLFPMELPKNIREAVLSLIENINSDGYLEEELEQLETPQIPFSDLQEALYILQAFDPAGVGARTVSECLVLQLYRKGFVDSDLPVRIAKEHLSLLEQRNLNAIRKACNVGMNAVEKAVEKIQALFPRPGSSFGTESGMYIVPDVFIQKIDSEFIVTLNTDGMPRLRISPYCKKALLDLHISDTEKKYIREKYQSAAWLLKSVYQRQQTIYKVTSQIVQNQVEFLENGIEYLKPMTLKNVADEISMHESTVSRVTTNKYVHTPQGIFELKYLFKGGIKKHGSDAIASVSVQNKIKQLISTEPAERPYSDEEIASSLQNQGLNIARRTVSKYRGAMGILSSSKRKPLKRGS